MGDTLGQPHPTNRGVALETVARERHDLLVVGGGITGAAIARKAALRGMRVALVERDDLASGTSGRSSRLIHGGLRYFKQGHLAFVRKSIRAQAALARQAPRLVRPIDFLVPLYANGPYRSGVVRAVMGLFRAAHAGLGRLAYEDLDARECLACAPWLRSEGLLGGFRYREFMTHDARLVAETAIAARECGASVLNYVVADELLETHGRVMGARVRDRLTGEAFDVRARIVVNAAGPWADAIDGNRRLRLSKGVHLVVPRERTPITEPLVLFSPRDARSVFAIPTARFVFVGTTETEHEGAPDDASVEPADVDYLLEALHHTVPMGLERGDVVASWAAVRPLLEGTARDPGMLSRDYAVVRGRGGVISVLGGKLSLHREMATDVLSAIGVSSNGTSEPPLPGEAWPLARAALESSLAGLVGDGAAIHLMATYGGRADRILARIEDEPELGAPLAPGLPHVRAELEHAVTSEMAIVAEDYACRRTDFAVEARAQGLDPTSALAGFGAAASVR
jgi:glycerol-3-phosphate dehydrogenase